MREQLNIESLLAKTGQGEVYFLSNEVMTLLHIRQEIRIKDGLGGVFTNAADPKTRIPDGLFSPEIMKNRNALLEFTRRVNKIDDLLKARVPVTVFYCDSQEKTVSTKYLDYRQFYFPSLQLVALSPEHFNALKNKLPYAAYRYPDTRVYQNKYMSFHQDQKNPTILTGPAAEADIAKCRELVGIGKMLAAPVRSKL